MHSLGPSNIYKILIYKKYEKNALKIDKNFDLYPRAFSKAEIIEITKYLKKKDSRPFQLNKHPTTINFHLEKLLDAYIIDKLKSVKK